jgi:signal transduction histidine kinase
MKKILYYFNPISYLGEKNYSPLLPLAISVITVVLSEFYSNFVLHNSGYVGTYIIFINIATIIYSAFRSGITGGVAATFVPVIYYFYIIFSRQFSGEQFSASVQATILLGLLYLFLAFVIGYLKQKIDDLIEAEVDEKNRLQTVIDQLPVGVVITDKKGEVLQRNRWVKSIIGKGKIPAYWPIHQTLLSGKNIERKEFIMKNGKGKETYLQIGATLIRSNENKIIAVASIISDITKDKELEKKKDDFVSMASHELKTPLTSMKLYLDYLSAKLTTNVDGKVISTLKGLKYQTSKLQELVGDLLDVSRIQTGKLFLNKEKTDINSIVQEAVSDLQGISKIHNLKFVKKRQLMVEVDKFRISQVLTNLLTNAMKYTPAGGNIILRVRKEGSKVVVSVKDTGVGIAKSQLKKVFDKLYQVSEPEIKTYPGLGMGLYISKEIIRRHKGKMWVESVVGRGSTFYFSVPQVANLTSL